MKIPTLPQIQQGARQITAHARNREKERQALKQDPRVTPALLRQYDAETAAQRAPLVAAARAAVAEFREKAVLRAPPDYFPGSGVQAQRIAALMAQAPYWSPRIFTDKMRAAIATGDRALIQALTPLAESYGEYKREFAGKMDAVLVDAKMALESAPEVVASKAAAATADEVDGEITLLDSTLGHESPVERLDGYLKVNALPNLLPSEG